MSQYATQHPVMSQYATQHLLCPNMPHNTLLCPNMPHNTLLCPNMPQHPVMSQYSPQHPVHEHPSLCSSLRAEDQILLVQNKRHNYSSVYLHHRSQIADGTHNISVCKHSSNLISYELLRGLNFEQMTFRK
jgi:hypothetical protein